MVEAGASLRRIDRGSLAVGALVALVCALGWGWLVGEAHPGDPMAMTDVGAGRGVSAVPPSAYVAAALPLWCVMMLAMMLPSAAPMLAAHARHARQTGEPAAATWLFAIAYGAIWSLFAVIAASAQMALVRSGLITRTGLSIGNDRVAGLLMIAVGLYELSVPKFTFLEHCRAPQAFLTRYAQPGPTATLALGFRYGLNCLGASAVLMGLLFVGGAMSIPWAVGLALLVLAQKAGPFGRQVGLVTGVVILLTGLGLVFRLF
jgi:predicted metal-binding membrane protein